MLNKEGVSALSDFSLSLYLNLYTRLSVYALFPPLPLLYYTAERGVIRSSRKAISAATPSLLVVEAPCKALCVAPLNLLYLAVPYVSPPVTPDRRVLFSLALSPPSRASCVLTISLLSLPLSAIAAQSVVLKHSKNLAFLRSLGLLVFQIAGNKS